MKRIKDTLILMNWWIVIPFFLVGFTYSHEHFTFRSQLILGPLVFLLEWIKCRRILSGVSEHITVKEIKDYYRSDYSHRWKTAREQKEGILTYHRDKTDLTSRFWSTSLTRRARARR